MNTDMPTHYQLQENNPFPGKLSDNNWNNLKGYLLPKQKGDQLKEVYDSNPDNKITLPQFIALAKTLNEQYKVLEILFEDNDFAYEDIEDYIGTTQNQVFTRFAHCLGYTEPTTI